MARSSPTRVPRSRRRATLAAALAALMLALAAGCASDDDDASTGQGDDSTDDDQATGDDDNDDDDNDDSGLDCSDYSDQAPDPGGKCAGNPDSIFPAPTGPYCIGTTTAFGLVDAARGEPFTPDDPDDRREVEVQVWYPIDQDATGEGAPYMDEQTAAYEESTIPATWVNMPAEAFLALQSHALLDAPIATGFKKFPLLLFSPGLKRQYAAYTTLIEDLVSHGYVVASINHPYISGMTVFPDGRCVGVSLPADEAGSFDLVVGDALFVLDSLTAWNADLSGDQPFACRFDLDKAAMYGHSYGGSTAMGAATTDPRLHAALNYDGPTFGAYVEDGADIPMFYFLSEEHEVDPDLAVAWENLDGPGFMANLAGSAHMSYSDYPLLLHDYAPLVPLWMLDMGTIDPNLALEIAHRHQRAFFDVYLKGAPIGDLLSIADDYAQVTIETKNVAP